MLPPTIHVLGNAALDETFRVRDLPRPGESVLAAEGGRDLGGKGANVAVAAARTGVPVRLVAAVGGDEAGRALRASLDTEGLAGALRIVAAPTDRSLILVDGTGENVIVTTQAAAMALDPATLETALDAASPGDLVALQLNLSAKATLTALRAARARGCRTALNPSPLRGPVSEELWPFVDAAFLNAGEAQALGGPEALRARGAACVVVTLGARGAVMAGPEGEVVVPAVPALVVDPTGAGDAFMAVSLASGIRRGVTLDACALHHGARAAALVVARPGAVAALPSREEMADILAAP
jgi:ribokinase